ncbi:hypothetical protein BGZ99_004502, partial [Dissophora globulifera]
MATKSKYHQSRNPHLRRGFVALTWIWDLFTAEEELKDSNNHSPKCLKRKNDPDETSRFSSQDLKKAKQMCWLPQLQDTDEDTSRLLEDLI